LYWSLCGLGLSCWRLYLLSGPDPSLDDKTVPVSAAMPLRPFVVRRR
jgi:hypothetical protein